MTQIQSKNGFTLKSQFFKIKITEIGEPVVPKSFTLPSDNSDLQVLLHTDLTLSQKTEISIPAAGI